MTDEDNLDSRKEKLTTQIIEMYFNKQVSVDTRDFILHRINTDDAAYFLSVEQSLKNPDLFARLSNHNDKYNKRIDELADRPFKMNNIKVLKKLGESLIKKGFAKEEAGGEGFSLIKLDLTNAATDIDNLTDDEFILYEQVNGMNIEHYNSKR